MKTAFWGLLLCTVLVSAADGQSLAGRPTYTLRVCNRTNHNVLVATHYIAVGDLSPDGARWTYHGWTRIPTAGCSDVLTTPNGNYWAHAEVEGDPPTHWGDDGYQCVDYSSSYTFYDDGQQDECSEGVPAMFKHFVMEDKEYSFEWDLN